VSGGGASRLQGLRWLVMCFTALALMRLDLVLRWKIIRVGDPKRRHELLLLCWARLASGSGGVNDWWSLRGYRCRLVKFLTQEVGLVSKENIGAFDLSEVEAKRSHLVRRDCQRIDIRSDVISEGLGSLDDARESLLFFGLERQAFQLVLPRNEFLELWASSISRNLQTPVADRASVLVVFLDLSTSDLQALSVVPKHVLVVRYIIETTTLTYHS